MIGPALAPGTHALTQADGTVLVHTGREGVAARVGHDLVLEVTRWTANVTSGEGGLGTPSVTAVFDTRSIEVREGSGGAMPLSEKDRRDITRNMTDKVLRTASYPEITLRSTAVEATDGGAVEVTADLTILGTTRAVRLPLTLQADGDAVRLTGRIPILQSTWDIRPFSAMLGALKVSDRIEVSIDVRLHAG